jgi:flagellar biosynthetic protein FlhB
MADEDESQRTEEPTARRLRRANEEGQYASSSEATGAAVVLGAVAMLVYMGGVWFTQITQYFAAGFSFDRKTLDTPMLLPGVFASQLSNGLLMILPLMLLTAVLAILGAGATGGYHFSMAAVAPKFSKLNPWSGIKRMLGSHALVELIKAVLKFSLVTFVLYLMLERHFAALLSVGNLDVGPAMALSGQLISESMLWLAASLLLIALIDVPYQRYSFMKRMRMTKQEIKDEMKDMEGRPEVKQQIRRRQREVATQRMMQKVKDADVIITNPEHFAVALSYDPSSDGAPILLAKGVDFTAARIREEAKLHGVEIFAAPELARALYFTTELDQSIPEALYHAVAQVIAYVFSLAQVQPGVDPMARPMPKIPKALLFDTDGKPMMPEAVA